MVGRVCCDTVGRLNAKSVILEGSRLTSAGKTIPLDLCEIQQYSLFPGQVPLHRFSALETTIGKFIGILCLPHLSSHP